MWEWLKQNANGVKATGTMISGLAQGYGAYQQSRYAKGLLNLQRQAYNRGVQREDKAQQNFDNAINSSFGKKKKKQPQMDLGVQNGVL